MLLTIPHEAKSHMCIPIPTVITVWAPLNFNLQLISSKLLTIK